MEWTSRLSQLNDVLGDLVPQHEGITKFVKDSGLKVSMINFNGNSMDIWSSVIDEARKNDKVDTLISSLLNKYPENLFLRTALDKTEINYSLSPKIENISKWEHVDKETLEVLTMGVNTFLPINFLERGIISSRSVAKIEIKRNNMLNVGTGFLFKIDEIEDIFFMTNYHVINNKVDINNTRIIFDFEEDINGNTKLSKSFRIDDAGPWYNSPVHELDVSIFKLIFSEEIMQFGYINLRKVTVTKNTFVNIIQHPGGQMKQIALYHNIITNTTDRVLQYLTDTMKGSSGSPVFNSDWEIVALHHSGGGQKCDEPEVSGTKYRNEGILINGIIDFLIVNYNK